MAHHGTRTPARWARQHHHFALAPRPVSMPLLQFAAWKHVGRRTASPLAAVSSRRAIASLPLSASQSLTPDSPPPPTLLLLVAVVELRGLMDVTRRTEGGLHASPSRPRVAQVTRRTTEEGGGGSGDR